MGRSGVTDGTGVISPPCCKAWRLIALPSTAVEHAGRGLVDTSFYFKALNILSPTLRGMYCVQDNTVADLTGIRAGAY
eukprot:1139136-Pelagomonas_calceolata.AAC.1